MEVVGALASSLQIISQCTQITMTIIKWVDSVRTVDDRIDSFVKEVNTLRATYESLSQSLKDPSMLEAARNTNRDAGGHLWTQMSRTLQDCEGTMIAITNVLRRIQDASNIFRPVIKQLKEALNAGELVRLREQVVLFNSSLQLPMQMITLTMQLRQQEMTTTHQLHLNEQFASLRQGISRIEQISRGLVTPRRQVSLGGSTLMGESVADKAWFDNMESYVETAKKFLDSASVAATTLSAPSVAYREEEGPPRGDLRRRGSNFVPLTVQKLNSISMYVDQVPAESTSGTPLASDAQSMVEPPHAVLDDSDDDDVDLQLLQTLLRNGHTELDKGDFATAEDNYREALAISQSNDFGPQVACSTPDVSLMLGECLVKQKKYDEAISLLQPLANQASARVESPKPSSASMLSSTPRTPDKGQALSANHLLGEVYLKKTDYVHAEAHAVQAFKGRKKLLGETHPKTIESVTLVIDMYKAKGQSARGEAYKTFLKPVQSTPDHQSLGSSPVSNFTPSPPAAESIDMTMDSYAQRPRRPTFNISSHFKSTSRAERTDMAPPPIPYSRTAAGLTPKQPKPESKPRSQHWVSLSAPFVVTDEPGHLSTSPNDTESLHVGRRPSQARQESINSNGSDPFANLSRWGTNDIVDQYMGAPNRQRSSLSKAPTLCAQMSRAEMEAKFTSIARQCKEDKSSKEGIQLLQLYDPESAMLVHRTSELKENMKRGATKGLAGTGYGFSPLHFFCSLKFEAVTEIELLLQLGVDVNAVAYKAGYGKTAPFTSLSLAVDRGHHNIVRLLLRHGADCRPEGNPAYHYDDRHAMHPLLAACSKGFVHVAGVLLEHGIQLSEADFPRKAWHGNSLLHEACFKCDLEMVVLLMSSLQRTNLLNSSGYSFIGQPGQQDSFGVTPVMYAVDMRDTHDPKLKAHKLRNRVACLKLLLGQSNDVRQRETDNGEVVVDHPEIDSSNRLATDLHMLDKKGNSVYWYADETRGGDAELKAFLDEQSQRSRLIDI
ncbi:hypothetical protein OHC33_005488 [Knufia fluminis]|uniref:Uncharacterized protein n=1 Tax=Knufia fluminis TaxID=191047 RepID=A0AAN8EE65_9EURO|nr:hypothetical protein OHC33_005488 [Knufia fluminis]